MVVRTAELDWEIHCHGGEAAVSRILGEFSADTATVSPASELEALLLQTRTQKTAQLALAQSGGCLRNALTMVAQSNSTAEFRTRLEDLLEWESVAQHLDEPWQVVIAGPPNAGKSSLLNAVAGYERSIVFDQPGTTRDAVQTEVVLNGWPFQLVDTAGLRSATNEPVETAGIRRARDLLQSADVVLIAVDRSAGWQQEHNEVLRSIPNTTPRSIVVCKSDLRGEEVIPAEQSALEILETSAANHTGLRNLCDWLTRTLIPNEPSLNTALPIASSAKLCHSLLEELQRGATLEQVRQRLNEWCD